MLFAQNVLALYSRLYGHWIYLAEFRHLLDELRTKAKMNADCHICPLINVDQSLLQYGPFMSGQHCAGGREFFYLGVRSQNSEKTVKGTKCFATEAQLSRHSYKAFPGFNILYRNFMRRSAVREVLCKDGENHVNVLLTNMVIPYFKIRKWLGNFICVQLLKCFQNIAFSELFPTTI